MKVGIITFTDGRKRVADRLREDCFRFQRRIAGWLAQEGHDVEEAEEVVWNFATARNEADRMADCDAVIFNFCVWSYPDFTAQAAALIDAPILCMGNINPAYPGWVAFFASAGALDEMGRRFGRALGDVADPKVQASIRAFLRDNDPDERIAGEEAAAELYGQRYGCVDGPSMGMYTGHLDPSQWMEQFGVHVFHVSQLRLAWLAEKVSADRVEAGLQWLEDSCAEILWNDERLKRGLDGHLARQLRVYLAMKDLCRDEGLDFCGLTGQLDYTEWDKGCTMDVPEALLNDTADWEEGDKEPIVCATECDSNGALTMQIMKLLSRTPVLFADLRHYHEELRVYDLVNSGQHAPWFAHRSDNWRENWKAVRLHPSNEMYFPCGGASVQFYADPAERVTFGRITRKSGAHRMHLLRGSFERFGFEEDERLAKMTTYEWPHAYARFDCSPDTLAANFSCNHIHAIIGDHVGALVSACEKLGIEPIVLD